jgi:hypothetical protein
VSRSPQAAVPKEKAPRGTQGLSKVKGLSLSGQRGLGLAGDGVERLGLMHGQIGEDLAVNVDTDFISLWAAKERCLIILALQVGPVREPWNEMLQDRLGR